MIGAVVAVGVVLALMLALIKILDTEKHFVLQLLLIMFVMVGSFLVLPKMVIDDYSVCDVVVSNSTVVANTTAYEYERYCYQRPEGTSATFYNVSTTMFYLFIGYFFVYLAVWAFFKLRDSVGGRK